ncbi:hypothetical protein [Crateriforma conspicua]|uniref:hypothetical protein n=1 Tax=Crateriforma conspicua TaxID=2527996 RepID=UPI0011A9A1BE|nr:hypothetical protein [Crateriforma conspicua]
MSSTTTESRPFVPDRIVVSLAQLLAFVAAVAIFPMSLLATIRFASSPFEVFIGVVLGGVLASVMVIIGMVTPSAIDTRRP